MPVRCCNLDWLEVHAREPFGSRRDALYYTSLGYRVAVREYGTRVYREMFTILAPNEDGLLEIRRAPSSSGLHGIHDENECHIRLTNRTCYFDNAARLLDDFLQKHGYTDIRISRVDICLDFERFDFGDDPAALFGDTSGTVCQNQSRSHKWAWRRHVVWSRMELACVGFKIQRSHNKDV